MNAVLRDKLQDYEKRHEKLEAEITKLRNENSKLTDENKELKSRLKEFTISSGLSEDEVKILMLLASYERELTAEMIARSLSFNLTKTKHYLDQMWDKYIYSHDFYTERPSEYYLLPKGREYLIKNNLVE